MKARYALITNKDIKKWTSI